MEDFFSMLTDEAPKKGARSVCGMCLCMCFCVSPPRKKRTTSNNTCSRCFASAVLVRTCGRFALTYVCIFSYLKCIVDSISICPVGFLSFSRKLCWFRTSPVGKSSQTLFLGRNHEDKPPASMLFGTHSLCHPSVLSTGLRNKRCAASRVCLR